MTELTKIANKHNTDKGTVAYEAHGYTEEYSKYIPNTGNYTLLEIGVYHCDSLRMWAEYNPDMSIHGVDIDKNVWNWAGKEINYELYAPMDATKAEDINSILLNCGSPDFIIDDGSHRYEDILASFKLLYPKLKPGGCYFIEDLHAPQANIVKLIQSIHSWLISENINTKNEELLCNNKLLIIQK